MISIKRILVPTDFTETSDAALDYAVDLAAALGAEVTLMHAYEIPVVGFPDGALLATPDVAARISEVAKAALESAVLRAEARGVKLRSMLREGVTHEEIHAAAEELSADLVVIGSHGRKGLARALLGSVAEHVVRTATRPVLTVHVAPKHPREVAA